MMGAARISGNALAASISLSQNYIAKRLRDEAPFTLDDLSAIASHFEIDPTEIVERAERHLEWAWGQATGVETALSDPARSLRAVADEDASLVEEMEAQQEGP